MPPPTSSPKLNTGITIDAKIKALADLVATHERRTFASLVEHSIWLYVQKRLPTAEIERVLTLLSKPKASSASPVRRGQQPFPDAPVLVKRRQATADNSPAASKTATKAQASGNSKSKGKGKAQAKTKTKSKSK